ncbi:hypothetical protein [Streptomyces sp. NBC_01237]|uniref:hypothetical protein n=1 Tax=Streptomyces sp. NBC_01237 TaxID=2903790 RepID=UPI002DD89EC0|nr:hypothetical protein [Streptomyces sp. NBC_01237]WRZ72661.1 hypothetical protein OG251_14035 [Streptomyces sp. NBC_01237]
MLRHVIAPSSGYTKASNDVVRERRLNSDAKVLLLYVQGLPESATGRPLGELADQLGMKGHAYQRAKKQLVAQGFVHEWSGQGAGGRWYTEQLFTNTPLTEAEARTVRARLTTAPAPSASLPSPVVPAPPTVRIPTVGEPTPRTAGGYQPVEDNRDKTTTHPPSEAEAATTAEAAAVVAEPQPPAPSCAPPSSSPAQLARAEQILLSLRHTRRELHLGVREARALAVEAVKWLERGLGEADLRQALLAERPEGGVRSAVGFLRYRLAQKCPEPPQTPPTPPAPPITAPITASPPVRELITCDGYGDEHLFRPLGDETSCPECRRATAYENWLQDTDTHHFPEGTPWRERFATVRAAEGLPPGSLV